MTKYSVDVNKQDKVQRDCMVITILPFNFSSEIKHRNYFNVHVISNVIHMVNSKLPVNIVYIIIRYIHACAFKYNQCNYY